MTGLIFFSRGRADISSLSKISSALIRSWMLPAAAIVLLAPTPLSAAFEARFNGARSLGLGCSLVADAGDPSARSANPAAASWRAAWGATASFSRWFDLPELDRFRLDAVGPFGNFIIGAGISGLGRQLYSERNVSLSASRRFHSLFAAGIGIEYSRLEIERYGGDGCWQFDAGVVAAKGRWSAGLGLENLLSTNSKYFDSRPPLRARIGLIGEVADGSRLLIELIGESGHSTALRFGIETELHRNLVIRGGYDDSTGRIHLGIGLQNSVVLVNGSYDHHPFLGWTRSFGASWSGKEIDEP